MGQTNFVSKYIPEIFVGVSQGAIGGDLDNTAFNLKKTCTAALLWADLIYLMIIQDMNQTFKIINPIILRIIIVQMELIRFSIMCHRKLFVMEVWHIFLQIEVNHLGFKHVCQNVNRITSIINGKGIDQIQIR